MTKSNFILTAICSCLLFFSQPLYAQISDKKKPVITLPLNNWTSQRVITKALGKMISSFGERVEYKDINSTDQWGALRKGLIHIQLEVWQASMEKEFYRMVESGYIVDMGAHSATGKEDWWYPDFVEGFCPGLPDWRAMNQCAKIFSTSTSSGKGVYHAGPWDYGDADIIRALNLNFVINRHPNSTSLWRELNSAITAKQPIMILNWTPNWIDARVKGKFVKFPAYTEECEHNTSWGLNKKLAKDCANPDHAWIRKTTWSGFEQQWPCVNQLIKNIDLTTEMIAEASALVVSDDHTEEQAVQLWLEKYENQVNYWLMNTCQHSHTS
ncbi:ABC transporter substrate-binding protein [Cognaticolwellia mytili]|uniref:ABC transporter substrate-binding protein n=1 Tax=Cognaticolwellia mytili TaxID=1888913 RepID=UPI000A174AB7|nr:ABC transporter substrate-binding protein [Cognaticolwellia mytili]